MKFLIFLSPLIFTLAHCSSYESIPLSDCKRIENFPGPEDIDIDREEKILYISSHDRRHFESIGTIFSLNLQTNRIQKLSLEQTPKHFRPHGIAFVKQGKEKRLYVISHTKQEENPHSVEVFRVEKTFLVHEKTLVSEKILNPNDLTVTEDGKIFISNDFGSTTKLGQFIDVSFSRKNSPISYYDGKEWYFLKPKLEGGNGIYYEKKEGREFLYRASMFGNIFVKYELRYAQGIPELIEKEVFKVEGIPDNFGEDEKGNLFLASHVSMWKFIRHSSSKKNLSPSIVYILQNGNLKKIYQNDGREISAASTALVFQGRIYISQVFEPFLLSCRWDN